MVGCTIEYLGTCLGTKLSRVGTYKKYLQFRAPTGLNHCYLRILPVYVIASTSLLDVAVQTLNGVFPVLVCENIVDLTVA